MSVPTAISTIPAIQIIASSLLQLAFFGATSTGTVPAPGAAAPEPSTEQAPVGGVRAARERARGDQALERLSPMSDADLRSLFDSTKSEQRLAYRRFDQDVAAAYRRAMVQGSDDQRATVARALRAALGELASATPADLAARITARGAVDPVNIEMRDAALHLAMLARVTGDRRHADRAAALLARFAEVVPTWPIWNPYGVEESKRRPFTQDDPTAFRSEYAAGLWGGWIYMDLMMGTPLVEAASILAPTGAIERLGANDAIRRMFALHLETQKKFNPGPDYSNMDSFQIHGLMDFGRLLGDPELVHEGVRRFRNMYRTSFYPDGWWHEGSVSYHADLQNGLRDVADRMLVGYSDPAGFRSAVDGSRFDDLDLSALVAAPSARAEAVMRKSVMPDGNYFAVHDTPWPWAAPRGSSAPFDSFLFGSMGQGTLVSGAGDGLAMATLHWGPTGSHAHLDALHLNLWAKGTEVISETQYEPMKGSNSTRAWHTSTAGHATVVVDGVSQSATGSRGSRRRTRHPEDAIEGVSDWRWRWGQQAAQDGGDLRLFATGTPDVQVIEADATRAYDMATGVTMYRRTVALVRIDDDDSYVVDIFRVRGARSSDFMLHASLQLEQALRLSVKGEPMPGSAHQSLTTIRSATVDGPWLAAFEMQNGVTLLTFMAASPGTTVIEASGPAMRRIGDAPFVIARRSGADTTFVAVHHAMRGSTPRVQGVEMLPTECPGCVAFKVRVGDRTDTVVSCADRGAACTVPGGIEMRGLFAHVAEGPTPADRWAMLADGDLLRTPSALIEGETSRAGVVRGTLRLEAGDPVNGFIVQESIPDGADLAGSTIIVDQAGEMSWAYGVRRVATRDGACVIETPDEPGLVIEPGRIKQTYFPGWGFTGEARYRVPGEAVARPPGAGRRDPPPTGSARATWTGA